MSGPVVSLNNISKSYAGNDVFRGLEIEIGKGRITSVIGPNGCGKTTLFRIILNVTDKDSGVISAPDLSRTGFLLDDLMPYGHLNLVQNMAAFSKLYKRRIPRKEINDIISITLCDKIKSRIFKNLSSGQKKKCLFALSLLNDPDLLILDEPFNSLDLKERIDMISSIKYINREMGRTFLISSHDLNSLYELCDEFCFIKDNRISAKYLKNNITSDELTSEYLRLFSV